MKSRRTCRHTCNDGGYDVLGGRVDAPVAARTWSAQTIRAAAPASLQEERRGNGGGANIEETMRRDDPRTGRRGRNVLEHRGTWTGNTHGMVSFESTDATNSLLMKRPVGTLIFLPVLGTVISTVCADMVVSNLRKAALRCGGREPGRCWGR